jgi:hypothetical protein
MVICAQTGFGAGSDKLHAMRIAGNRELRIVTDENYIESELWI